MAKRQSPSMYADDDQEPWTERVMELEKECDEIERNYLQSKERCKDLKEALEKKVSELRSFIRAAREPMPLFDAPKPKS